MSLLQQIIKRRNVSQFIMLLLRLLPVRRGGIPLPGRRLLLLLLP